MEIPKQGDVTRQQDNPLNPSSDPFNSPDYQNMPVDDDPLPVPSNMVDSMISDDQVPDEIKTEHWWIFNKDVSLGFLDGERKKEKLLNFDIVRLDSLSTTPYSEYSFESEKNVSILRSSFEQKLERAVGTNNSNVINERKALISQISESRNVSDNDDSMIRESFIKKLIGKGRK